jgi:hypothetical protein
VESGAMEKAVKALHQTFGLSRQAEAAEVTSKTA